MGLYQEGGHFYTVYAVAIAKGYSQKDAYKLAYFTQLPDEIGDYSAWENPWQWGTERAFQNQWLHDVQEVLHSLHGADVQKRRNCLRKLLEDPKLKPIDRGLLLHAFGDSYAHTYTDPKTGKVMAYEYPYGHAEDGTDPDLPSLRPGLYGAYVNDLFNSLPPGGLAQNPGLINAIVGMNHNLSTYSDAYTPQEAQSELIKFIIEQSGYPNAYRPEKGNYSNNHPTGTDDLGPLTKDRVQRLIDLIKKSCCGK